jgi:glycopeptide antibiotics resistance protein
VTNVYSGQVSPRVRAVLAVGYLVALGVLGTVVSGWWLNRLTVRFHLFFLHRVPALAFSPDGWGYVLNVILFAPLGLLVGWWRWWSALLIAALLSSAIELVQLVALQRVASLGDVAANTLGCALGWLLARCWR